MNIDVMGGLSARHGHDQCVVCGDNGVASLKLAFAADADGAVHGVLATGPHIQGYDGLVHGGVIATVLDAAMTHCLFHRGVTALTADLHVRYVHAVVCKGQLDIHAYVTKTSHSIYYMRAELVADGKVLAWAEAKFLPKKS